MSTDPGTQLRRRREASRRLPQLEDATGRRDPMDPAPQDRARRVVSIRVRADGAVALVRGWPAREVLEVLAVPWQWSASSRGHVIDARHVGDAMAYAEHRRLIVNFRDEATE